MQTTKNAVILARVSSKAQEEEGYSLNAQEKLLKEYAGNKQLKIVKIFKIAETASKQTERKTFHELLKYLDDGKAHHLIVEKTDRLTRNLRDAVSIDDWLEEDDDRRLHLVKESSIIHKSASSNAKFMWGIHLVVAKKYTDNLREEVAKGTKQKLEEGWLPGKSPIGYKTVGDTGKRTHVIDSETAPFVRKMFEKYLEPSMSIEKVTKDMAKLGLKTRFGKPLSRSHVQKTLRNPFYIGINRWCGVDYTNGLQEHLISKEMFEAVQAKMTRKNPPKYNKHNPDYKGLFTCINCGGMVTWEQHKGYWYGHCNSHSKYNGCPKQKWIRQDNIEQELLDMFDLLVCPSPAIMDWVKNALRARHETTMHLHHASTDQLRTQLDTITRKKDILYEDRLAERISSEAYDKKYKELLASEADTKEDLESVDTFANQQFEHGMKMLDLSQKASEVYASRSPEQKRIILTRLFSNLSINGPALEVELTELAVAIADKVKIHKELVEKFELNENDPKNRGRAELTQSLRSLWLVQRGLNAALNNVLGEYDPLAVNEDGTSDAPSLDKLSEQVTQVMRDRIGSQVEVIEVMIPVIHFDEPTQGRINALQAQIAQTRIAQQASQTAAAQAAANQTLSASVSNDPNVLVSRCFDLMSEMIAKGQAVPVGFTCWPGSGSAVVIPAAATTSPPAKTAEEEQPTK